MPKKSYLRYCNIMFILLLIVNNSIFGYDISGVIHNAENTKIYLQSNQGGTFTVLDSARIESSGHFKMNTNQPTETGFYRLLLNKNTFFDIIVDQNPIKLETHINALIDSMTVFSNHETRLYFQILKTEREYKQKLNSLQILLRLYKDEPDKSQFTALLEKELNDLNVSMMQYQNKIISENEDTFLSIVLSMTRVPSLSNYPQYKEQYDNNIDFLNDHFLDNIDFDDPRILNSNILPSKYTGYLNLGNHITKDIMIDRVNHILEHAIKNDEIYNFTLKFLVQAFEKSEYDDVFLYLTDLYSARKGCTNQELEFDIETARKIRKNLQPGKKAPNIRLANINKDTVALYNIHSRYTIVLFWASWCSHCIKMLPELGDLYEQFQDKNLEIFAVSLDRKMEEWKSAIQTHNVNWVNVTELQGWSSQTAKQYNIHATPTFYLLNKEKEIIEKNNNIERLYAKLNDLL